MKNVLISFLIGLLFCSCAGTAKLLREELQDQSAENLSYSMPAEGRNTVEVHPRWSTKDTLEVDFLVSSVDVRPVFGTAINLQYDPDILEYMDFTEGNFLEQGGASIQEQKPVYLVSPGRLTEMGRKELIIGISLFRGSQGVKGSGKLITLRFKGKKPGATEIVFTKHKLKDVKADDISEINWPVSISVPSSL
ncbi:MAG: cohesin domain-containing protein [bacterium]